MRTLLIYLVVLLQSCSFMVDSEGITGSASELSTRFVGVSTNIVRLTTSEKYPQSTDFVNVISHAKPNEYSSWKIDTKSIPDWITIDPVERSQMIDGTETRVAISVATDTIPRGVYETEVKITGFPCFSSESPSTATLKVVVNVQ